MGILNNILRGLWGQAHLKKEPLRSTLALSYPSRRPYAAPSSGRRKRPIPDRIGRFYIPLSVLEATDRVMRRFGDERRECYVWWGGYFTPNGDAQVLTAIHPEIQTSYGHIQLGIRELSTLDSQLRELDQVLLVELHTHPPGAGGQNDVDAAHPAVTYRGFITIVVPDFAYPRFYDLRETHVYEYLESNRWRKLDPLEITRRFAVEESFISIVIDDGSKR